MDKMAFGLAGGILWGACMLLTTLVSAANGYGAGLLNAMASIYPGYAVTYVGSLVGMVYGFVDAFVGCYLFAWLYNMFEKKG
jgi:hypothetical protein